MLHTILALDVETDGVSEDAICIEVACALYNVEHAAIICSYSTLMQAPSNAAESVNGIPPGLLKHALPPVDAWQEIREFALVADCVLAHNAEFDKRFVPKHVTQSSQWATDQLPWICTMGDTVWPKTQSPRDNLVKLALAHGLGVSHAHRASVDVDLICRLLTRAKEMGADLQEILEKGLRPKARFISLEPYKHKDVVKSHGFGWDGEVWSRVMALEDAAKLPFRTKMVEL
jgi:DNA polymerase III subunit epsilon